MEEATTAYPRQQSYRTQNTDSSGSSILLYAVIALVLSLIALPWIIAGFAAERVLARWLHWRLSLLLWMVAMYGGAFLLYTAYQHGLQPLMNQELVDYIQAAKHFQTDFAHWPLRSLWSATWPVWVRTWPGVGIAGFGAVLTSNRRTDTARTLRQQEQRRQRKAQRLQYRAKKRASLPARIPDEAGGMMVIGVPIHDDMEEDLHG